MHHKFRKSLILLKKNFYIQTIRIDILILGAGSTGLFTVFEAGLLKLRCHLIDVLPQPESMFRNLS